MGGAGYQPAPLGNLPSGGGGDVAGNSAPGMDNDALPIPSGRLPDGPGW